MENFNTYYDSLVPFAPTNKGYKKELASNPDFIDLIIRLREALGSSINNGAFNPTTWEQAVKKEWARNKGGMFDALQEQNTEAKRKLLDQIQFYQTENLLKKYPDLYNQMAIKGMEQGDIGINIPFGTEYTKLLTPYIAAFNWHGRTGNPDFDDNLFLPGMVTEKTLLHEGRHGPMEKVPSAKNSEEVENRALDYAYESKSGGNPLEAEQALDYVKRVKGLGSVEDAKQYIIDLIKESDLLRRSTPREERRIKEYIYK